MQGPPVPPRVEHPEAVKDLAVFQIGQTLEISFTLPVRATDGERLSKPLEAVLFRQALPSGRRAPQDLEFSTPWLSFSPDELRQHTREGRIAFRTRLSEQEYREWQGSTLVFSVRTLTRGFRRRVIESEFSNTVRITLLAVSGSVQDLEARTEESAIKLSWAPARAPGPDSAGLRPAGYHVYRSRTGDPESFQLQGETTEAKYFDTDSEFNRTYLYKVRVLYRSGGQVAESEDSAVAEITPRDVFPPAVPAELAAIFTAQGVELIWTPNTEADLAGYNVYRRQREGPFERVNREPQRTSTFRDTSAEADRIYSYRVTALDLAGNESAPSEERTVETR